MSRTWTIEYGRLRPGMPPGRYALAMRRYNRWRRDRVVDAAERNEEGLGDQQA